MNVFVNTFINTPTTTSKNIKTKKARKEILGDQTLKTLQANSVYQNICSMVFKNFSTKIHFYFLLSMCQKVDSRVIH